MTCPLCNFHPSQNGSYYSASPYIHSLTHALQSILKTNVSILASGFNRYGTRERSASSLPSHKLPAFAEAQRILNYTRQFQFFKDFGSSAEGRGGRHRTRAVSCSVILSDFRCCNGTQLHRRHLARACCTQQNLNVLT